ncbi:glycosyltransferase [Paraburkholderia caffeinitolerans]|uniref:glycosyltransferase n=1 Tax=Paraburkholderia caffeinitolerans TaxID=1723730 RepID=UPI0015840025|nr:glycosyltransferase [Paraburkholderia caffeinitolerans]
MRALHIYRTYFPDPPGGLQEAIRQIALGCSRFDVESTIFTLSPDPHPAELQREEGRVIRCRSWAAPASCDLGGPAALRRFRELSEWADIVHFHFPWPFGDVLSLFGARTKPAVMTYHSDIVRQRALGAIYGPLMRRTLRSMSAVVATSPAYARTSPVLTGAVAPERLHAIPLGIADYADMPMPEGERLLARFGIGRRPMFLSLGVLRYYKGLHTLIEAARHVDADFVIAGSGPEMERLQELKTRVGAANVIFAGQVDDEEKRVLLSCCRGLVLSSHLRSEAFGMVLVEAAMYGKPMVSCEIGTGTSFVNEDGVTGWVVPPEAPDALAAAIETLACDDAQADAMGRAARARYELLFSGEALGRAYSQLYRDVMHTAGRAVSR